MESCRGRHVFNGLAVPRSAAPELGAHWGHSFGAVHTVRSRFKRCRERRWSRALRGEYTSQCGCSDSRMAYRAVFRRPALEGRRQAEGANAGQAVAPVVRAGLFDPDQGLREEAGPFTDSRRRRRASPGPRAESHGAGSPRRRPGLRLPVRQTHAGHLTRSDDGPAVRFTEMTLGPAEMHAGRCRLAPPCMFHPRGAKGVGDRLMG